MSGSVPSDIAAVSAEDLFIAHKAAIPPGTADPAILRSLLRQEQSLARLADLLTEIRDRLPPAPVVAPTIDPAPSPAPQPPAKRSRGS